MDCCQLCDSNTFVFANCIHLIIQCRYPKLLSVPRTKIQSWSQIVHTSNPKSSTSLRNQRHTQRSMFGNRRTRTHVCTFRDAPNWAQLAVINRIRMCLFVRALVLAGHQHQHTVLWYRVHSLFEWTKMMRATRCDWMWREWIEKYASCASGSGVRWHKYTLMNISFAHIRRQCSCSAGTAYENSGQIYGETGNETRQTWQSCAGVYAAARLSAVRQSAHKGRWLFVYRRRLAICIHIIFSSNCLFLESEKKTLLVHNYLRFANERICWYIYCSVYIHLSIPPVGWVNSHLYDLYIRN